MPLYEKLEINVRPLSSVDIFRVSSFLIISFCTYLKVLGTKNKIKKLFKHFHCFCLREQDLHKKIFHIYYIIY